jgi:hypothetical protein
LSPKGIHGHVDAQVADHRESREGIAAAAAPDDQIRTDKLRRWVCNCIPRNYRLETTIKASSESRFRLSRLSELCRTIAKSTGTATPKVQRKHRYWVVANQRKQYSKGKTSSMTPRIQELKACFEWDTHGATWEDRLSEFADYRNHGTAMFLRVQRKTKS